MAGLAGLVCTHTASLAPSLPSQLALVLASTTGTGALHVAGKAKGSTTVAPLWGQAMPYVVPGVQTTVVVLRPLGAANTLAAGKATVALGVALGVVLGVVAGVVLGLLLVAIVGYLCPLGGVVPTLPPAPLWGRRAGWLGVHSARGMPLHKNFAQCPKPLPHRALARHLPCWQHGQTCHHGRPKYGHTVLMPRPHRKPPTSKGLGACQNVQSPCAIVAPYAKCAYGCPFGMHTANMALRPSAQGSLPYALGPP